MRRARQGREMPRSMRALQSKCRWSVSPLMARSVNSRASGATRPIWNSTSSTTRQASRTRWGLELLQRLQVTQLRWQPRLASMGRVRVV